MLADPGGAEIPLFSLYSEVPFISGLIRQLVLAELGENDRQIVPAERSRMHTQAVFKQLASLLQSSHLRPVDPQFVRCAVIAFID